MTFEDILLVMIRIKIALFFWTGNFLPQNSVGGEA